MRELVATCLLLLFAVVPTACDSGSVGNDGDVVGGPCALSSDCDEDEGSACFAQEQFPGGYCSVRCSSEDDCPDETTCIRLIGGNCLLNCKTDADCRSGYLCTPQEKISGGNAAVCIGPPNVTE